MKKMIEEKNTLLDVVVIHSLIHNLAQPVVLNVTHSLKYRENDWRKAYTYTIYTSISANHDCKKRIQFVVVIYA